MGMSQRDKTQRPLVEQDPASLQNPIQKMIHITTLEKINPRILFFCNFLITYNKYLQQRLIYTQEQDQPSFRDAQRAHRK